MTGRSKFEALLAERMGLDPESIGSGAVSRAVQTRANDMAEGDLDGYWTILAGSARERQALIELIVVPETWFFRYPESLNLFAERVQSLLHRRQSEGSIAPVRIISLPCSTGEEPYSIVMALLARGMVREQFVVHALDISSVAIARARSAIYGKNAFRTEDLRFRDQFFTKTNQDYVLHPAIRAAVDFRVENIFDLSADTRAAPYDFVFCRNLLIYFDPETQRRALDVLGLLSTATSELFVGPAEASLLTRSGYTSVGTHRAFAFAQSKPDLARGGASSVLQSQRSETALPRAFAGTSSLTPPAYAGAGARTAARMSAMHPSTRASGALGRPATARRPGRLHAAAPGLSQAVDSSPATAARSQVQVSSDQQGHAWIHALADQGRVEEASQAARQALAEEGPDAGLFYLLGLCLDAQNDLAEAAVHYRKALYLDPGHVAALTHLAVLLDTQGDGEAARRLRQRAMKREAGNG